MLREWAVTLTAAPLPRADIPRHPEASMIRVAIIGCGEIGTSVEQLYREARKPKPILCDPARGLRGDPSQADVIHVCVPASAVPSVVVARPRHPLYIVHSTVPVGTCRGLAEKGPRIVHAPVRGVHPHLAESLRTFRMPLGGASAERAPAAPGSDLREAEDVLRAISIPTKSWIGWESTELAKLLCTTRLGLDVLWMRHVSDLCDRFGADFDRVYTEWAKDYSDGFEVLGHWEYRRPILKRMPGPIGGHCVMPNARMLAPDSPFAREVSQRGAEDWQPGARQDVGASSRKA